MGEDIMVKLSFWISYCPVCGLDTNVRIFDQGSKFWIRLLAGNNRYACRKCKVTWLRKKPKDFVKYSSGSSKNSNSDAYSKVRKRPKRTFNISFSLSKKDTILYCFIAIFGIAVAFTLNQVFFSNYQKLKMKPKIEGQNINNQEANTTTGRNDKYAGKAEIQKLKSVKKNW